MSTSLPPQAPIRASLTIDATVDAIADATEWLGTLAEAEDWPMALKFGLELSVEEALANVVSYAFEGVDAAPMIRLDLLELDGDRIGVRIVDNGIPFDPTNVAEPEVPESVEDAKIGGHGVQLMRHFLESLTYQRQGDENHLTLVTKPKTT
ncbi:ATP-binding protein [Roseixanthobacter glucoisosaccharinicivorans]|uniref:ATP-binding protein n=1 Tax=Roseixanthobacter glucoisosaccharinicivorans TaxID=3119923 RepID=UPI003728656F